MSARSCLLCGRPLSRWAGAGDEFCSREHRNQYRLRRSMDRLQEANKVASVMRRRESPRPLKASRLINGGPREPRAFHDTQTAPPQPASIPRLAPACPPRMAPSGDLVAIPLLTSGAADRTICPAPPPVRAAAPSALPLRVAAQLPGPQMAPPITVTESSATAAKMRRRVAVGPWKSTTPPVIDGILRRSATSRVYPMAEQARPGAFGTAAAAAKGRALRVSLAAAFRIPDWNLRPIAFPGPQQASMIWPDLHKLRSRPHGAPSGEVAAISLETTPVIPGMRIPAAPPAAFAGVFRWPGAKHVSLGTANPAAPHRTAIVPFSSSEEYKERPHEYRN